MFETANYIEAGLWVLFSLGCLFLALKRQGKEQKLMFLLAGAFFLFGMSDVVEVHTGAWWRPWWLLIWKAVCIVFVASTTFVVYRRRGLSQ